MVKNNFCNTTCNGFFYINVYLRWKKKLLYPLGLFVGLDIAAFKRRHQSILLAFINNKNIHIKFQDSPRRIL